MMNSTALMLRDTLSKKKFEEFLDSGDIIMREGNEPYIVLKEEKEELNNKQDES